MSQTVTVTSKWQVHIPVEARKRLKLTHPVQMEVEVKENALVLTPKKSKMLKLLGSIKPSKATRHVNIDSIRDAIDYSDL